MDPYSEQKVQVWRSFIHSLNPNNLSRTVKVISGTYLQGSLYNFSFSPGEVIRITGLIPTELKAVVLERDKLAETILDVPLFYKGEFLLIPDPDTYETVGHLVNCVKIGEKRDEQPRFQNKVKIPLAEGSFLNKGEKLALLGIKEGVSGKMLKCQLVKRKKSPVIYLPMNCRGIFQECRDDNYYTLDKILAWKIPVGRSRIVKPVMVNPAFKQSCFRFPKNFNGQLVLQPSYSVKALLAGGVETTIPTQLDFEIVDITDAATRNPSVAPIYLEDVYAMPNDKFPLTVRIADGIDKNSLIAMSHRFNPTYFEVGKCLTILTRVEVKKYLVTEISQHSAKRRFLVPWSYHGIFQRTPRTFQSVYDLDLARDTAGVIEVIATQCYAAEMEGLSSFTTGDRFRTVERVNIFTFDGIQPQTISVLECENIATHDIVWLPMHAIGTFLEVLKDGGKFTIKELLSHHKPPCHVKVIAKDRSLPSDLLFGINELKVDGEVNMKYVVAKCTHASAEPFEIPVEIMKVMVLIMSEESPSTGEQAMNLLSSETVELLSADNYELLKGCDVHPTPPPLPPKSRSRILSCGQIQIPPIPPRVTKKNTHTDPFLHDDACALKTQSVLGML
ncbi:protein THEMIS3-like [Carcharodon carcharias]|uniref:protein THEMIS3-like n=1 Tax=Carcharodon carcharias TaxID=13397 RepID=UPI001B7E16EC|nr:protein THEMIS3-like [Carcharodon carcharias]